MHYRSILFPPAFQASFHKLYEFGRNTGHPAGRALIKALCAVMAVIFTQAVLGRSPAQPRPALLLRLRPEDYALFAGTLLSPVLLTLILMHRHQAFWDRYAIASQAAIFAGVAIFLGARLSRNRAAAYAACLILLYSIYTHQIRPVQRSSTAGNAAVLDAVRPDLPLVVASDITFFEMNRYEDPTLLGRLYWLRDRTAAVRYAHATMFEDFLRPDLMRPYVPVPAHVETYPAFIQQHRQFLLLGTMGYAEDWLIPKLENDGAKLSLVGKYEHLPYKDTTLYLVTMPATSGTPANL